MNRSLRTPAMIDSGATALFINKKFVEKNSILKRPLKNQIKVNNIDGTSNKAGYITHYTRLTLSIGAYKEDTEFLITDLSPESLILGLPWLKKVNPRIDWVMGELELLNGLDQPASTEIQTPTYEPVLANCAEHRQWLQANIIEHTTDEVWCLAGYTYLTDIASKANQAKASKPVSEMIPPEYQCHSKVFSEEESHRLPKHQPWDHTIDLKPDVPETI